MKKTLFIFILTIFLIPELWSQQSYFINDTAGTVPKRITAYTDSNYTTHDFMDSGQYLTITGTNDAAVSFSFGDSLFAAATSYEWAANSNILHFALWIPQYSMIWYKSLSGTANVNFQFRKQ